MYSLKFSVPLFKLAKVYFYMNKGDIISVWEVLKRTESMCLE